jgi:hypothetical protein
MTTAIEPIKSTKFRHKKSGLVYMLSNIVYNIDGTIHHASNYLSGFQLKDDNLYGRSRDFHPHQVEKIED